jgi:uncharacterized protein (TIGR02246 family)
MKTFALSALTVIAALGMTSGAHAKSERCAAVNAGQVEGWFKTFNDAWATKNPDTVTALFTKDAVLLATVSNKPRTTPDEVKDYFVTFLQGSPVGTINTSTIKIGCNSIARLGTWTVALTNAASGVKTDVKARYSFIYKREGGQWKIDHLHSSMMPEPTS